MLRSQVLKYLLDVESAITELEKIVDLSGHSYSDFSSNFLAVRAAERDLMIIGEAMNKLRNVDSNIKITGTRDIIGLRNLLVHSYDSIDPTLIWKIMMKDIPILKKEIEELRM